MLRLANFIEQKEVLRRSLSTGRIIHASKRVPLEQPGPPHLPIGEQREFEDLVREAARRQDQSLVFSDPSKKAFPKDDLHPDAPKRPKPEFEGDVNPVTGERGGPKIEPVKHNDWSHSGRVTDF